VEAAPSVEVGRAEVAAEGVADVAVDGIDAEAAQ